MNVLELEPPKLKPHAEIPIIYGKKTIGFPFVMEDLGHLVGLLRDDKMGYLGSFCLCKMTQEQAQQYVLEMIATNQIFIWTFTTKEGKASRRAGYAWITNTAKHTLTVGGLMDIQFARGLTKVMRRDKRTYAEDAFRSLIEFCFNKIGVQKINSEVCEINRRSIALDKKVGFKREGVLRKIFEFNGKLYDTHWFGLLKEEYSDGR